MTTSDLLSIVAIAAGCALLTGAICAVALRLLRRRSIVVQVAVVAVGAVAATLSGVTGVAAAMFLSTHDFTVVMYVCVISVPVATLLSLELSRRIARAGRELTFATRCLGEGSEAVLTGRPPGSELSELAGELSTTSAKLTRSRERERAMEGSRRELIAWISHDLRAPLTGLLTVAQALSSGNVADTKRLHEQLRGEVNRVIGMVDDLFELSHAHDQGPRPRRTVELYDVVSKAVADIGPVARARAIGIDVGDISGVAVRIDDRQLARALNNLLLDGIRHTSAEGIVTVDTRPDHNGHITICITYGDAAVATEDANHVVETAWRGDRVVPDHGSRAVVTRRLSVVKGLVEASGGTTAVTYAPEGCRVEITLPLAPEHVAAKAPTSGPGQVVTSID